MKKFLPTSTALSVNKKGFTLVELLIVISIIAILSVIGVTVFSGVQKNARDAKRRADIDAITTSMEKNYVSGSSTPYTVVSTSDFSDGKVPVDPQSNAAYTVTGTLPGKTYVVCATLENTTAGNSTSGTAVVAGAGTYFCRQNQQ